jgi:xylan alpha-glucuronosyltransferase
VARIFPNKVTSEKGMVKEKLPAGFLHFMNYNVKIGLVNMEEEELRDWGINGQVTTIKFERVSTKFEWKDLFPEWIDEEEDSEGSTCPEVPMPDVTLYDEVDVVVARLPCKMPEEGWNRDVFRLQVHMVSAKIAARRGRMNQNGTVKVIFISKCEPMMDIFRCDDLVHSEGEWWMYEANVAKLEEKLRLPLGSCSLALPLWDEGT